MTTMVSATRTPTPRPTLMRLLEELGHDVAYAVRTLRREPVLAAGIVATFALAIGANAAMFGLVDRLMLAPPPGVRDAQHVARVKLVFTGPDGEPSVATTTSYPAFRALAALERAFAGVAATKTERVTTGRGADIAEIEAVQASGQYFAVLGARPALGRFFGPEDDELPAGSAVAVLSHAYWTRRFAGEASVLGRPIVIDNDEYTVIGVAPSGFSGDELSPVDVFVPLTAALRRREPGWSSNTGFNLVSVIVRTQQTAALGDVQRLAVNAVRPLRDDGADHQLTAVELESLLPGAAARQSPQARTALWLSGVSLVVLLIATANVGTLLLLRAMRRRREIAVRIALGVGRGRLARQLLTESLLLSVTGGAIGLLVSHWLSDVVRVTLLPDLASSERFVDVRVLVATLVAACAVGVIAGLVPLAQIAQRHLAAELQSAGLHVSLRRSVFQALLVGLQVALCTVLLVGAGLFVRSLQRVQSQDLGFTTARLLYVTLDFREELSGADHDSIYAASARSVRGLSGVTGATVVEAMPFGNFHVPPISVPGLAEPPNAGGQMPMMYGATRQYLDLMGVRLRAGRLLEERDGRLAPLVVLVNETMARSVWPGQSALGKCVRVGFDPNAPPSPIAPASLPCREVVGVVRDSRVRSLRTVGHEAKLMQYYVPFAQLPAMPFGGGSHVNAVLVGTAGDPERMIASVQRLIQGASTSPVYARVRPYQDLLDPQLRPWRLGATLFSAFGGLALGIAGLGLFGVVSYLVTQRTREIGVRLALGGTRGMVSFWVVRDALRMVAMGVGAGTLVALMSAPLLPSLLFETAARDVSVLGAAGGMLLAVTILAAAIPAWRAGRVSPMTALRSD